MTAVSVAQTRLMTDVIDDATRGLRDLASRSSNNAAWVRSSDLVIVQIARIINGRRNNVLRPVVSPPHVYIFITVLYHWLFASTSHLHVSQNLDFRWKQTCRSQITTSVSFHMGWANIPHKSQP